MNSNLAYEIAREYVGSGKIEPDGAYFPLGDEDIWVVVVRVPSRRRETAIKSITESVRSTTPRAAGDPCPRCNGTGRIY